jgi:hypothetical protein
LLPPVPADDPQAWDRYRGLQAEQASAPPQATSRPEVFQTLHDLLTARYPCICTLSDDEVDDGVWSDGPLINNFGERVATLGVTFGAVDKVLPFLIQQANELGLVVLDPQSNRIHRPETRSAKPWWQFWK